MNALFTKEEQLIIDEVIAKLEASGLSERVFIGVPMPLKPR